MMALYMHTLDGRPATFDPVDRTIYFVGGRYTATLAKSLRQIRKEQRIDRESTRIGDFKYGYVLVREPSNAD